MKLLTMMMPKVYSATEHSPSELMVTTAHYQLHWEVCASKEMTVARGSAVECCRIKEHHWAAVHS